MKANMGRYYRLYPAARQAERLTGWGHTSRAVWNVALAQRQFAWTQRKVTLRAVGQNRRLTEARAELPWLADLPAQSGQQMLRNLDAAYDNWWNRSTRPDRRGSRSVAPTCQFHSPDSQSPSVC